MRNIKVLGFGALYTRGLTVISLLLMTWPWKKPGQQQPWYWAIPPSTRKLTHWGLVTPDGTKPLPEPMLTDHHWDLVVFTLRAISQKMLKISVLDMSLIITHSRLHPHLPWASELTHWGWVMHIHISELTIIGSDNGLFVAWLALSHYLNQCWNIINLTLRNKLQWNVNRNSYIFSQENTFENAILKWQPFCLGLNVLKFFLFSKAQIWACLCLEQFYVFP